MGKFPRRDRAGAGLLVINQEGVTNEEPEQAKQCYLQSQKVGCSSDPALAAIFSTVRHLNRTMAYDGDLDKKIETLTPDQVAGALRQNIDPAKLVVVTAGDFGSSTAAVAP